MSRGISFRGVGHATSLLLATSFVLCVGFDLLFPAHAMFQAWERLLPGFQWISWRSFFLGLIESYGYGWYFAMIGCLFSACLANGKAGGLREDFMDAAKDNLKDAAA